MVKAPEKWQFRCFDDEMSEVIGAAAVAFWPSQGSEIPMVDYLNKTPKHGLAVAIGRHT